MIILIQALALREFIISFGVPFVVKYWFDTLRNETNMTKPVVWRNTKPTLADKDASMNLVEIEVVV